MRRVGVGGLLAEAVGQQRLGQSLLGRQPLQRDLFQAAAAGAAARVGAVVPGAVALAPAALRRPLAPHAQNGAPLRIVGPGAQPLLAALPIAALAFDADAGEQRGEARVFVVVAAADARGGGGGTGGRGAVGSGGGSGGGRGAALGGGRALRLVGRQPVERRLALRRLLARGGVHLDEIGQEPPRRHAGAFGQRAAVLVGEAPHRGVDVLHATEALATPGAGLVDLVEVVQAQAPPRRVDHLGEPALVVVAQADGLARGQADARKLASGVEPQLAAVSPGPGVFGALLLALGAHPTLRGRARVVAVELLRALREGDAPAVGLHDLQPAGTQVQLALVAQAPAAAEPAGTGLGAVVVAHELQAEHAGQRGEIDFALELVAVEQVDRVAGAEVDERAVALAGDTVAAAGGGAGGAVAAGAALLARIAGREGVWGSQAEQAGGENSPEQHDGCA